MELKASLQNLRMAPRKVRLVTNLVKGKSVTQAKGQLAFLAKKPAPLVLKLLNSAIANAKHNFEIPEQNLFIKRIMVESGPTLKRWLPRAQGRATPLMKRTCSVKLVLDQLEPTEVKKAKKSKPQVVKPEEVLPVQETKVEKTEPAQEEKPKGVPPQKPYGSSSQSKKRHFSRQTFGNIKKVFRRKSV